MTNAEYIEAIGARCSRRTYSHTPPDPRVLEIVRESGKPMLEYQSPDAEDFFDNYNRFYEAIQ